MARYFVLQIVVCACACSLVAGRRDRNCASSPEPRDSDVNWSGQFFRPPNQDPIKRQKIGRSVLLRCNHFGFTRTNPPPVKLLWYKNGRPLFDDRFKFDIYGCNEHPPYNKTTLRIVKLEAGDSGNYTCRLMLRNASASKPAFIWQDYMLIVTDRHGHDLKAVDVSTAVPTVTMASDPTTLREMVVTRFVETYKEETSFAKETIFVPTGFGVIVLIVIGVIAFVLRRKRRRKAEENQGKLRALGPHVTRMQLRSDLDQKKYGQVAEYVNESHYRKLFPFINDEEWTLLKQSHVDRESVKCEVEFSMPIVLGTGNFGHVYRGEIALADGSKQLCAVKRLNDGYKSQDLGHFLMEAITLLQVGHHCNVVSLVGSVLLDAVSTTGEDDDNLRKPPILLMELASEGNLKNYLHERRLQGEECHTLQHITHNGNNFVVGKGLTFQDLTSFTFQSARGMQHLASKNIIHRDLAARNVLVTSDKKIKIADFGLSKHIRNLQQEYYRIHTPAMTPAKWTAPEALWENKFSVKSDVWSFGVLLWEIFTMGGQPYQGITVSQLYRKLASGFRLAKPNLATENMYKLMKSCWAWEADARPDFKDLVQFLDGSLATVSQVPYVDFNQRVDSVITSTSTDTYSKSGSEHSGSDSVFDHTDSSCGSVDSLSSDGAVKDSAFSTMTSQGGEDRVMTKSGLERQNFVFSELINPVYEDSDAKDVRRVNEMSPMIRSSPARRKEIHELTPSTASQSSKHTHSSIVLRAQV